ncbi:MAG TPA: HD domain-containing protein [Bacteroidales bacterium]|nr:HD domain-containing protein [Bacteroidales bacterium]
MIKKPLNEKIQDTEARWLSRLFHLTQSHFTNVGLPSHNHWHHLRVWGFMKELLAQLNQQRIEYSQDEMDGLIIACFFHDAGMTQTLNEAHGRVGADLCRRYFIDHPRLAPHCILSVLEAIEIHDNKQYPGPRAAIERPPLSLLLTVADDLDAFGKTGILRYTEILILRGWKLEDLPARILKNAQGRMNHLEATFAHNRPFIEKQRQRYNLLTAFFQPLADSDRTAGKPEALAMLRRVKNKIINKEGVHHRLTDLLEPTDTPFIQEFRKALEKEWADHPAPASI